MNRAKKSKVITFNDADKDGLSAVIWEEYTGGRFSDGDGYEYMVRLFDQETGEEADAFRHIFGNYVYAVEFAKRSTNNL